MDSPGALGTAPQIPDLYEPVGKLKVDHDVDELARQFSELKTRFESVNFDAVLTTPEELKRAGVTDTTCKRNSARPKRGQNMTYESVPPGHDATSHRPAAMLSLQTSVSRDTAGRQASKRVSDLVLPPLPSAEDEPLPVPAGVNKWACLQDAVNQIGKENFNTVNSQLGWRKWALMHDNVNVVVDVFWWLAATFFCKEDANGPELREFLYHRFSRHFINVIIEDTQAATRRIQTRLRDTYQRNFIEMISVAACNLFCAAVPRSTPLFDSQFRQAVVQQLRIWTSGFLPGDTHRAVHAMQGATGVPPRSTGSTALEPSWRQMRLKLPPVQEDDCENLTQVDQVEEKPKEKDWTLCGKAARGGFDIAKTSPFVAHFLGHHGLHPNDLNRGLLNRHVCGAPSWLRPPPEEEIGVDPEEDYASFATEPISAGREAAKSYLERATYHTSSKFRTRKRLQQDLLHMEKRRQKATHGEASRKLSNKLANWVEFTKEKAVQQENDRRDDSNASTEPEKQKTPRIRNLQSKRMKDSIDVLARFQSELSKAPERTNLWRSAGGARSTRVARQARAALDRIKTDFTGTGPS